MQERFRTHRRAVVIAIGSALACGPTLRSGSEAPAANVPRVVALSKYRASLGSLIEVFVQGMPSTSEGDVALRFQGTYTRSDGRNLAVDQIISVQRLDGVTVQWSNF